jgi:hypothetical protein
MPLKNTRDLAIKTPRDVARREERIALAEQWALLDAKITDLLGSPADPKE